MSLANVESETQPNLADRIVDAAAAAAHLSHKARLAKSSAEDAIEDGRHAAERAVKSGRRAIERLGDDGIYYVRRQPLRAMAIAAAVGLIVGVAAAVMARGCARESATER